MWTECSLPTFAAMKTAAKNEVELLVLLYQLIANRPDRSRMFLPTVMADSTCLPSE